LKRSVVGVSCSQLSASERAGSGVVSLRRQTSVSYMWGYIIDEPGTPASARGSRCPGSNEKATISSGVALMTVGACPRLAPGHNPKIAALATVPDACSNRRRLRWPWMGSMVAYPGAFTAAILLACVITGTLPSARSGLSVKIQRPEVPPCAYWTEREPLNVLRQ